MIPGVQSAAVLEPRPVPREQLLRELLRSLGEGVGDQLGPEAMIERLSAAIRPLVPHDWLDLAWADDDNRICYRIQSIAQLPDRERPGPPELVADSILAPVLLDGLPLLVHDY